MEAIEEPSIQHAPEVAKVNVGVEGTAVAVAESDLCPKSNGVGNPADVYPGVGAAAPSGGGLLDNNSADAETADNVHQTAEVAPQTALEPKSHEPHEVDVMAALETSAAVEHLLGDTCMQKPLEELTEGVILESATCLSPQKEAVIEEPVIEDNHIIYEEKEPNEKVTFETEVLVEKNDNGGGDMTDAAMGDNSNNILNEIGHNIELSDVLRSSDGTDGAEHNNSAKQEVFNKEELLDILEGNDQGTDENISNLKSGLQVERSALEAEIALKQLSRLKSTRNPRQKRSNNRAVSIRTQEKTPRKKRGDKKSVTGEDNADTSTASENCSVSEHMDTMEVSTKEKAEISEKQKSDSIVNVLVKDWDDDEPSELDESNNLLIERESTMNTSEPHVESQGNVTDQVESSNDAATENVALDNQTDSKKLDDDQPQSQRRQGRVIKKKIPFDPDNPDTFTKAKNITKTKEKEPPAADKELLPKKPKLERPKSKSPISKLAWKKPQPKNNSKQNKRLTEVDKLLMDEGAVNMIYQLTPEAPKGKKNMRTKAEFIKKIQSSTPDLKEMKFRERKAIKVEDEAKKILSGKRTSLSSSAKSPSACEEFETQSADDSIIYRRHSSSSYSSSCMSPRRLSDVDACAAHSAARSSRHASDIQSQPTETDTADQAADIFMANDHNISNEINKDDCLSIKEKLNTKLSQALKKRKRDSSKVEKPLKQKRISKEIKNVNNDTDILQEFKYVSVSFDQRMAEICIKKTGSKFSIEMLKELEKALQFIDSRKDISVTFLSSECGTLCSELNLFPLIDDNMERRTNYAYEIAESVRAAVAAWSAHGKLAVAGAWGAGRGGDAAGAGGAVGGAALALGARADVLLASESARFALAPAAPLLGVAALSAAGSGLSAALVKELVVLGRCVGAAEAQAGGLVARALWPGSGAAPAQARALAGDLAAQPPQSILLKKQLLRVQRAEAEATFQAALEKERDLLVQYWTSVEGQEQLRATLTHTHP